MYAGPFLPWMLVLKGPCGVGVCTCSEDKHGIVVLSTESRLHTGTNDIVSNRHAT